VGRPLSREDGFAVYNFCWPSPAQSFTGPTRGTMFCCLRFETSLFVACYDSQGHGGGIRPRLHTGYSVVLRSVPSYNSSARTPRKMPSSVIKNACLLVRYLAIDILLFRAFASAGMCLARGMARTTQITLLKIIVYCSVRVFRTLPRNGSTCHNIYKDIKLVMCPPPPPE
jgi:hypothetical protein